MIVMIKKDKNLQNQQKIKIPALFGGGPDFHPSIDSRINEH